MTNDKIKKMLYNYPKLNQWIRDYEQDLENIREQLDKHYSVNASVISDMPRSSDISDTTLNKVITIDKLKTVYIEQAAIVADKIKELYEQKRLIEYVLPLLTPTQQFIAENRYFKKLNWNDVVNLDSQKRSWELLAKKEHNKMLNNITALLAEKERD